MSQCIKFNHSNISNFFMTVIYSKTVRIENDILEAFRALSLSFSDQFAYYDKSNKASNRFPARYLGLGRCVALDSAKNATYNYDSENSIMPVFFSFNRFDEKNTKAQDLLMQVFPNVALMLPEIVLIQNEQGNFLQLNSLGPFGNSRIDRFVSAIRNARSTLADRYPIDIPYILEEDDYNPWNDAVAKAKNLIGKTSLDKVVLSRRIRVVAKSEFEHNDMLFNLIFGNTRGIVIMYKYADVVFCGCTPELLVRQLGTELESMCLAGTLPLEESDDVAQVSADLMSDKKNRQEHAFVVDFIRSVFDRNCYDVKIPQVPEVLVLPNLVHLMTPASAKVLSKESVLAIMRELHPTPALAGFPVGEAIRAIREIENYNRGFYGGAAGIVHADGSGEFSVALRSGVFDNHGGWIYAGCGIVEDSDAQCEFQEINQKAKTVLAAFGAQ